MPNPQISLLSSLQRAVTPKFCNKLTTIYVYFAHQALQTQRDFRDFLIYRNRSNLDRIDLYPERLISGIFLVRSKKVVKSLSTRQRFASPATSSISHSANQLYIVGVQAFVRH